MNKLKSLLNDIRTRLVHAYMDARDNNLRKNRYKVGQRTLLIKLGHLSPLSSSQREEVLSFWNQYRDVSKVMQWFEFYNWCSDGKADIKRYIPDSIYYSEVDTVFTEPRRSYELDDKNHYDLFFHDVRMPKTIVRKCKGLLMDREYHVVSLERAVELCRQAKYVISMPARNSEGGKGIRFFDFTAGDETEELKKWLTDSGDLIVQDVIKQHEAINQLYAESVNSIRIMSIMLDGEIHILSSVLRMGRNGAKIDNTSNGGIVCGIKEDGWLREVAFDNTGEKYSSHPQGGAFKDYRIVGYDKCLDVIREVSGRMGTTTHLISWDFAIDQDGEAVLIEVNLTFGGVNIHQMCNGPIFGDMTEDILSIVYHSNSKPKL